jgi:hypothetical protein
MADAVAGHAPALLGRGDALGQARTIEALYRFGGERSCGLSHLNARLSLLQVHHGGCTRPAPSTERHKNACGSRPVTSR